MMINLGKEEGGGGGGEVRCMKKQVSFGGRVMVEKQKSFKKQKSMKKQKPRDSPGKRGDTVVHTAARSGNLEKMRELLVPEFVCLLSKVNQDGETPLYVAAEKGYSDMVAHMLIHMDLNSASLSATNGYDAFHVAARFGHVDVVRELLNVFPNLAMTTDLSNMTALHTAATHGHAHLVDLLLESDSNLAKIARNNGKTVVHSAARMGRLDILKSVLSKDPTAASRTDMKGQTALHMAVKGSNTQLVAHLLNSSHPSIVSFQDNKGNTPLHVAVSKAHLDNLKCLLAHPNVVLSGVNKAGETPLDIAQRLNKDEAVSLLLQAGAANSKPPTAAKQLKQIKHDVESQLQQSRQTGFRVHKIAKRLKKLHISGLNNAINSATVVAVLIATVAFAAIFTVPGQFVEEGVTLGQARIANDSPFIVFFVFDSLALFISLAVVVVQTSVVVIEQTAKRKLVFVINKLMWLACLSISGAFVSLTYVVVGSHSRWLAVYATAIGASIMLTTIGSMCYCVVSHRIEESKLRNIRRLESRSRSFSASDSEILNSECKRMYAL